jgi:hypothetical protein
VDTVGAAYRMVTVGATYCVVTVGSGTLHEDLCTFIIISRSVVLRVRNVSDGSCREIQNTHFMFNNLFPKIVPFLR